MRIESENLSEIGRKVSCAMCRNPMCGNFGIDFVGNIPEDGGKVLDERYTVRVAVDPPERAAAEIECRACGQRSRLGSNRAIRPIARYFLSLSLPFADCLKVACENHGKNLFETWDPEKRKRPYRRLDAQTARCKKCQASFTLGTPRAVQTIPHKAEREKLAEEKERRRAHMVRIRQVRGLWKSIVDGVRSQRKVSGTLDIEEDLPPATYYTYLEEPRRPPARLPRLSERAALARRHRQPGRAFPESAVLVRHRVGLFEPGLRPARDTGGTRPMTPRKRGITAFPGLAFEVRRTPRCLSLQTAT